MKKDWTIKKARMALDSKEISSKELTEYYLNRISEFSQLNAYITICSEKALDSAKEVDDLIAKGEKRALLGIPLAIKDLFCTKGIRTTAGSKMLADFVPEYESTVSQNLLNDGAIFLGKTNMDEFAMGSANITSYFG
ncbi:MAG: Asp-tRNA(Asn)/Glu-tRNA(Gln) amidotransferase subunit GatA, partial [Holosporales bacterium]|nr:Asp-tRNA(Asn)/Glu-tRNA(Gln) amidotransferase subunit GatA [Holosporales bacterium]